MIKKLILVLLTLVSVYKHTTGQGPILCSSDSDSPISIISSCPAEKLPLDSAVDLEQSYVLEDSEYIRHYTVSSKSTSYRMISVSGEINMIERTSKFGTGYSSFPVENVKKALSNDDNRLPIDFSSSNNGYPLSAIGMLSSVDPNSKQTYPNGSIFMAPGGFGITAAHCVYNELTGFVNEPKGNFKLTNILSSSELVFDYSSYITDIFVPNLYFSSQNDAEYDWAVIKFADKTLENKIGAFNIASGFSMYDKVNTSFGFPKDKGFAPHCSSGKGVLNLQPRYYDLYQTVSKGMSGCPIMLFNYDSVTLDEYNVVTAINSQINFTNGIGHLRATRITNSLVSLIRLLK